MKFIIVGFLFLIAAGPVAADTAADAGYRNCGPHNLAACQNSNQLFWGLANRSGNSPAKRELRDTLTEFLRGAPKLYLGKTGFSASQVASGALVGPGDHHDRISGGWFFDGFTPHDAQERGAVLFDAGGAVTLVALLNVENDEAGPDPSPEAMNRYRLRIYGHGKANGTDIRLLQNWAGYTIKTDNRRNAQTQEILLGTEVMTLENNRWRRAP